jgi:RNA polymerase sigma-70 factor, ECF subfamily
LLIAEQYDGPDVTAVLRRQHAAMVRRALFLTKDRDEAMDLVQDAFERALRSPRALVMHQRAARSWLERILTNLFIDRWRQRKCRPLMARDLSDDLPAVSPEPDPPWADLSLADLEVAVSRLPEALRRTFCLYHFEGVRYDELSRRLRVPQGTVASRLLRARRRLRELMLSPAPPARAA